MTTAYSPLLGLALPVTGELAGTWGDTVNDYITSYLDSAVAGTQTISGSQTAVTLSKTTNASLSQAGTGATGSAQYNIINCTGNPAGLLTITAPAASKTYLIINATSTSQSVKIVGAGPTTGVTLIAGEKALVAWNGSDFIKVATTAAAAGSNTQVQYNSGGNLAGSANLTFDGTNLTLNGGTANGVAYLNGSKVLTTGSALSFDGANLGVTSGVTTLNQTGNGSAVLVTGTTGSAVNNYISLNHSPGGGAYSYTAIQISGVDIFAAGANLSSYGGSAVVNSPGSAGGIIFKNYGTEGMRLTSSGLEVKQSQLIGYSSYAGIGTNGLAVAGNVGIGTSSPAAKLDVSGTARVISYSSPASGAGVEIDYGAAGSGVGRILAYDRTGATAKDMRYDALSHTWKVGASLATTAATLDSSGNLGIGTTSITAKLTVAGTIESNLASTTYNWLAVSNSGQTAYFGVDSSTASVWGAGNYALNIRRTNGTNLVLGTASAAQVTLDSSGNLGLGVTPSGWSNRKAFEGFYGGALSFDGIFLQTAVSSNCYYNGTNWIYKLTNWGATRYETGDVSNGAPFHKWYTAPSGTAGTVISFTQAMTLNANGALVLQGGNTSASGVGVAFPATQSASSDANTLDDYEEGTWTPTVDGITATYGNRTGRYTKIGNFVIASVFIDFVSITSADGGNLTISGFPFAVDSSGVFYSGTFGNFQNIDLDADTVQVAWNIGSSATTSTLRNMKDNAAFATLPNTRISASTSMYITWTYRV